MLAALLEREIPAELALAEIEAMLPLEVAASNSRSVLGSLNQIAWWADCAIYGRGATSALEVPRDLARMIVLKPKGIDFPPIACARRLAYRRSTAACSGMRCRRRTGCCTDASSDEVLSNDLCGYTTRTTGGGMACRHPLGDRHGLVSRIARCRADGLRRAELVQVAETLRSPASLTGTVGWKTIKGRRYAYWQFKEIDGKKREYYLGPEGPAIAAIENARSQPAPAFEALARQARAAVAQGNVAVPPKHFRIVKRFAGYQFFRAGGLLVGMQAFLAMGNQLGVAWGSGTRTLDLDFAHGGIGGNVAVALPADLHADVGDALKSLEMGFLPALGGSRGFASQYVSKREPDLRIDFLTPVRRAGKAVIVADLGVALTPLKFLDYLLERPGQAVLLDRADACLVNLPDPARYGLHKLLVAAERERGMRNTKRTFRRL